MIEFDEKCTLIKAEAKTINGNVYTRECLQRLVEESNSKPRYAELFDVGYYNANSPRLEDTAGVLTNFRLEDDYIACTIKILDTPNGVAAQAALDAGYKIEPAPKFFLNDDNVPYVASWHLTRAPGPSECRFCGGAKGCEAGTEEMFNGIPVCGECSLLVSQIEGSRFG